MWFFSFVGFVIIASLLWIISRNTGEALDKQAALHYEIVNLNKRIEELLEKKPLKVNELPKAVNSPVNINAASLDELIMLSGIGKVVGQRIIDARPIADREALLKVQGLSVDALAKFEADICY